MRIGYLTDLHYRHNVPGTSSIAKRRCRQVGDLLRRALAYLAAADVDIVLCTGDLIDDPEHPAAIEDLAELREMFGQLSAVSIVLPGNHDPHPDVFYQVFQRPALLWSCQEADIIVFGGDHVRAGERASERSSQALVEMDQMLSAKSRAPWTVLAQHYLVYPERNSGYPHNYANDAEIISVTERSPRRFLSISGHYHAGGYACRHNNTDYVVGSAFCEAPHRCFVIELSEPMWLLREHHCEEGTDWRSC